MEHGTWESKPIRAQSAKDYFSKTVEELLFIILRSGLLENRLRALTNQLMSQRFAALFRRDQLCCHQVGRGNCRVGSRRRPIRTLVTIFVVAASSYHRKILQLDGANVAAAVQRPDAASQPDTGGQNLWRHSHGNRAAAFKHAEKGALGNARQNGGPGEQERNLRYPAVQRNNPNNQYRRENFTNIYADWIPGTGRNLNGTGTYLPYMLRCLAYPSNSTCNGA